MIVLRNVRVDRSEIGFRWEADVMDNVEELPSWAAQVHVPGSNIAAPEPPPEKRRTLRYLLLGLFALLALVAVGGLGYWAATLTADDDSTTASETLDSSVASETGESTDGDAADGNSDGATNDGDGDGSATAAGDTDDAEDSVEDSANGDASDDDAGTDTTTDEDEADETTSTTTAEPVDNSDGSIRYAVLTGGQLFLRGRVPSEEYGSAIEEVAIGVLGPDNVINEYEVDPTTPELVGGPVYVEDVVLFEFNSVAIAPPFLPILDLGTALMVQNPSVEITVVSRTDAVGSEDVNLEVSQQRGQAVVNYWIRQGIDPSRITIDARGEEEASSNLDESALDRRVEFVINNLFG